MEDNQGIQVLDTDIHIIEDTPVETTYTQYEPINFENGTLVTPGSYNSETGELTMPVYSGKAPVNATNLNHLEQGIVELESHSIFYEVVGEIDDTTGEITMYNDQNQGGN